MKNIDFDFSPTIWALPLYIDISRWRLYINVLCFEIVFWFDSTVFEQTPEEEMADLESFEESQLKIISEWRADIQKRMGVSTA